MCDALVIGRFTKRSLVILQKELQSDPSGGFPSHLRYMYMVIQPCGIPVVTLGRIRPRAESVILRQTGKSS